MLRLACLNPKLNPEALHVAWGVLGQVRSILDDAYQRLLGAMMSTIERLAASDPKYGNKLRLENTSALLDAVAPHSVCVPVLASFRDRLSRAKENAVQVSSLPPSPALSPRALHPDLSSPSRPSLSISPPPPLPPVAPAFPSSSPTGTCCCSCHFSPLLPFLPLQLFHPPPCSLLPLSRAYCPSCISCCSYCPSCISCCSYCPLLHLLLLLLPLLNLLLPLPAYAYAFDPPPRPSLLCSLAAPACLCLCFRPPSPARPSFVPLLPLPPLAAPVPPPPPN